MIVDVIRSADNEHKIYFFLTAYLETARSCDKLNGIPDHITRLPLNGITDLRMRFEKLVAELDAASKQLNDRACVVIRETLHVYATALDCLRSLEGNGQRQTCPA